MKPRSISDDDLCSACQHCAYRPGELSTCALDFPALGSQDGYIELCVEFQGQPKYHVVTGRRFKITGCFTDDEAGTAAANAFMDANPGHGVLEVTHDGRVIVASCADKGTPV